MSNARPSATPLLLTGISRLYTCDDARSVVRDAWLLIRDGIIVATGTAEAPASLEHDLEGCTTMDLAGAIVMPGFINIHHHFFQSLTRALPKAQRSSVIDWLLTLYPLWAGMQPIDSIAATRLAAAELLLSGCTTSADHAYLSPGGGDEFLEAEIEAARAMGMRLHLCVGAPATLEADIEQRLSSAVRGRLIRTEAEVLSQMERFAGAWHDVADGSMTRIVLGPTGVSYEKPAFMRRVAAIASDFGCGLHTHLHPRQDERAKALEWSGTDPIGYLQNVNWLRPGTWLAHGSQLSDEDMDRMAANGVGLAHCPHTIPRLGFPLTRISELRRRGVRVAFATDGCASNDGGSMLAELRLGLILHRIGTRPGTDTELDWLTPEDALWMATREAAGILGRSDIGSLVAGRRADICGFRMDRIDYAGAAGDPLGALLMAGTWSRADLTIVEGELIVRDGTLVRDSEADIASEANRASERLAHASA